MRPEGMTIEYAPQRTCVRASTTAPRHRYVPRSVEHVDHAPHIERFLHPLSCCAPTWEEAESRLVEYYYEN